MLQAIARIIGGCHLVAVEQLQAEMDARAEARAVRLAQLQAEPRSRRRFGGDYGGGMAVVSLTF